jgi:hypothetical protein
MNERCDTLRRSVERGRGKRGKTGGGKEWNLVSRANQREGECDACKSMSRKGKRLCLVAVGAVRLIDAMYGARKKRNECANAYEIEVRKSIGGRREMRGRDRREVWVM